MEKIWLKNYPQAVPETLEPPRYGSLQHMIDVLCDKYSDKTALANFGVTMTYRQLDQKSRDFAAYLSAHLGLEKGDRVALMMPNVMQYPVALFGVLRAGLVAVNVNPLYTGRELLHELRDADVSTIIILENFANTLESVVEQTTLKHIITTQLGDMLGAPKGWLINFAAKHIKHLVPHWQLPNTVSLPAALKRGAALAFTPPTLTHDDVAFLQYTGGTTGRAKGAVLTHGNLVYNVAQARAWMHTYLREGQEVIITALPLYHVFSLMANCLLFAEIGGTSVLITNPRDMKGFVKALRHWKMTAITGVNTLFSGLLHTPGFDSLDFSKLWLSLGGGMAVQNVVAKRWKAVTGVALLQAYGLTETSPAVCINLPGSDEYSASVGFPLPSTEVDIRDDDARSVGVGDVGEVVVRGPQVMRGYWNQPQETRAVLGDDGWLCTGDMGYIDADGRLFLVDRKKDMILVSGFNVYPNEIEDVVAAMEGVREVAAIGVSDEYSGEVVKLLIVKDDDALTAEAVKAYCKKNLTGYKHPHYVVFRDQLPKSNVGKILRRVLKEQEHHS